MGKKLAKLTICLLVVLSQTPLTYTELNANPKIRPIGRRRLS
jgi:hypothetical protein